MPWPGRDRVIWLEEVEHRFGVRLKTCPFCSSSGVGLYIGPMPHVTCLACGADGPLIEERHLDIVHRQHIALQKWNMRP
ncbi:Lar family restriction alleviation protein [Bradyrhizobium elkanii]|uniref:Uncharacterized protein n=1 Tax=Bradyrhizobium elkanii TaxID=29448 RepID=A0ABV4F0C7_BRAEL|nr:Lar family restriction alleviation protein [Bradyrhizobium elkanii]MCP1757886.1 hypothetical protein [Bradyrhizobium elkanii]MCS3881817.1 hypothetical protein [Bradyrhizobium elkanii]MCS4218576.1 hypothetical protein [Bradyrhizobium elkanii]MCW2110127.1 hypothetical protein [Bradyrhizobium elkanii]MCW2201504.1 hypothetical protein [Bradyrhizobium elkanii]